MTTFIYVGSLLLHILTIFLEGKNVFFKYKVETTTDLNED